MRSKPVELAQAVAVAKMRLRGFIMKQGKHHKDSIAHVKDLMRELNKYKQGRDGINMPIYIASDFSDVLKEINALLVLVIKTNNMARINLQLKIRFTLRKN